MVDEFVSAEERDAIVDSCDCFVSLHRSEGFGLALAEAMAHGKPVIGTGYSGNLDFMDVANSHLVPYRLVAVPEDWWAHAPGAEWAEPDVDAAAALMRRVYRDQDEARALGERGRASILGTLSLERTATFIEGRLAEIGNRARTAGSGEDVQTHVLRASQELGRGFAGSLDSGGRGPRFFRRLLSRALWPYLAEQHRLNRALLDAVVALQRNVDDVSARLARLEDASVRAEQDAELEQRVG